MKILIINDNGVEVGGVETYLKNFKKSLISDGYEVEVLTSRPPKSKNNFNDISFTGVNRRSMFRIIPYIFNVNAYITLKKALKEFKPDVVHINFFFYHTSPSILLLLKDIPTVMTIHAHELLAPVGTNYTEACGHPFYEYCIKCNGIAKYYPEKIKRILFNSFKKNIDLYIAPSRYYENLFASHGYGPIVRVPYGLVEKKEIQQYEEIFNYQILFIGRLVEEKGAQYIISALPEILKKFPQAKLTIVGTGEYENELKSLVQKLKLEDVVNFTGKIPNDQTPKYYKKADIIVALSDYPDNLPTVCIEAMKYGKPIIASDIGGFPDLVENGKNGFLIPPGDVDMLATSVIQLFSDEKLRKNMQENAYVHLENYFLDYHKAKLISLYQKIMDNYE